MAELGLELSPEKTRVVGAGEGFDFLGFRFLRQDSQKRGKRQTRWFPSPNAEQRIRDKVWAWTRKEQLAKRTPKEAKVEVEAVLRGWGEYFRKSLCAAVVHDIWDYANTRLARMSRWQHLRKRIGRREDQERRGLRLDKPPSPVYPTRVGWRAYDVVG